MYSQKNEEEVILKAVEGMKGRFLDIGAYNGETYSNTLALLERGWSGVMIEPGLQAFQALLARHGSTPGVTLIHSPVTLHGGLVRFWNNTTTFSTTEEWARDMFRHEGFSSPFLVQSISVEDVCNRVEAV